MTQSAVAAQPRVASLNLCADQLLLLLAGPEQVQSLSWLAQDASASHYFREAAQYPVNRGRAEQVLALQPDLVLVGPYGSRYTERLLKQAGIRTYTVPVIDSLTQLKAELQALGAVLERAETSREVIARLDAELQRIDRDAHSTHPLLAAVYDPNGLTTGRGSLRGEALHRAGYENLADQLGISAYGQLPLETMLTAAPDVLLESPYSEGTWSRAEALSRHPALYQRGLNPHVVRVASRDTICAGPWLTGVIDALIKARRTLQP